MQWFGRERGSSSLLFSVGAALVAAALVSVALVPLGRTDIGPSAAGTIETAVGRVTPGQDGRAVTGDAVARAMPAGETGRDVVDYVPVGAVGSGLGAIAGGASAGDVALGLLPGISAGLTQYGLNEGGVGSPVDVALSSSVGTAVAGAIAGDINVDDIALSGVGAAANATIENALTDIPVVGGSGAVGGLVSGLVNGGGVEDLGLGFGKALLTNVLPVGFGQFVNIFANGLTGRSIGASAIVAPMIGMAIGGPVGALVGGLAGGLLDKFLGVGTPKTFDVSNELGLTEDGQAGRVVGLVSNKDYMYVPKSFMDLPLRDVQYELRAVKVEATGSRAVTGQVIRPDWADDLFPGAQQPSPVPVNPVRTYKKADSRGPSNTKYFIGTAYQYEPLFPTTGTGRTDVGPPASAVMYADAVELDSESDKYTGREITGAEYATLQAALGGTKGTLPGNDPRVAHLRSFQAEAGAPGFTQDDATLGVHSRTDVNNDGMPETIKTFAKIDGFVDGDGRSEVVQWGFPAGGLFLDYDVNGDGVDDKVRVTPDNDGDGKFDTAQVVSLGTAP